MNINYKVPPEFEKFVDRYKELGFRTKTELVNEAIKSLKLQKNKDLRRLRRDALLEAHGKAEAEFAWETIDGEDFPD